MLQLKVSKPANVAAQLGGAWAVGAVALPMAWQALVITAFAGETALLAAAAVGALAVLAYLIVVITATGEVSVLGASGGRRVLWALLVMGGGTAGWALGWSVTDVAGLGVSHSALLTLLLGGVPFALVAGLFLRGWQFRTGALGLSVALIVAGVVVLRHESPDELEARLAVNGGRGWEAIGKHPVRSTPLSGVVQPAEEAEVQLPRRYVAQILGRLDEVRRHHQRQADPRPVVLRGELTSTGRAAA